LPQFVDPSALIMPRLKSRETTFLSECESKVECSGVQLVVGTFLVLCGSCCVINDVLWQLGTGDWELWTGSREQGTGNHNSVGVVGNVSAATFYCCEAWKWNRL